MAKGAGLPTIGFALTLVFAGGAAGKLVCALLGARIGAVATVCLTEMLTAAGIIALLLLPLAAVLLIPEPAKIVATFLAVLTALALTGGLAAWLGDAPRLRAIARVVVGGALALGATFAIGSLLGMSGVV
jgi:VIT1/CCC1 family predicted Fe2+/Mn2+ transporter